jgi:hypothetical protein
MGLVEGFGLGFGWPLLDFSTSLAGLLLGDGAEEMA